MTENLKEAASNLLLLPEIRKPYAYVIDPSLAGHHLERLFPPEFREKFSKEDKKMVKVYAFIAMIEGFYTHLNPFSQDHLPFNTIMADNLLRYWYGRLEQSIVWPAAKFDEENKFNLTAEVEKYPDLNTFLIEDLIKGKFNLPSSLETGSRVGRPFWFEDMLTRLEEAGWGTKRIKSYQEYVKLSALASQTREAIEPVVIKRFAWEYVIKWDGFRGPKLPTVAINEGVRDVYATLIKETRGKIGDAKYIFIRRF